MIPRPVEFRRHMVVEFKPAKRPLACCVSIAASGRPPANQQGVG